MLVWSPIPITDEERRLLNIPADVEIRLLAGKGAFPGGQLQAARMSRRGQTIVVDHYAGACLPTAANIEIDPFGDTG